MFVDTVYITRLHYTHYILSLHVCIYMLGPIHAKLELSCIPFMKVQCFSMHGHAEPTANQHLLAPHQQTTLSSQVTLAL